MLQKLEIKMVLEILRFEEKYKLICFRDSYYLLDCDSVFEKFQQNFSNQINYFLPEKNQS